MVNYNLTVYGSGSTSAKDLGARLKDAKKYLITISTNMNQIQSTANGWLNNTQVTSAQTNLANVATIVTSLNDLAGLTRSLQDFISNWKNNSNLLQGDLNMLNSFVSGTWSTYVTNLNNDLEKVQSIISQITTANTTITSTLTSNNNQVSNLISNQVGPNGQNTTQLLTALTNDQQTISGDITNWNNAYALLTMLIGTSNATPAVVSSIVNNSQNVTQDQLNQIVQGLTSFQLNTLSNANYAGLVSLQQQFGVWQNYFAAPFANLLAQINTDVMESKAGNTNMSTTIVNTDMTNVITYVNMLYNLTKYWADEISLVSTQISNMDQYITTIAKDTNKMIVELKAIIMVLNSALGAAYPSQASQITGELKTVQNNLQSYSNQLSEIANASSSSSPSFSPTLWIVGGLAVIVGFAAWLFYRKKGGKNNG